MQNQHPALSLLAKPFDRPPLPSFAIWLLSVPSLPMAVLYRDATLWEPRALPLPAPRPGGRRVPPAPARAMRRPPLPRRLGVLAVLRYI